ncbi:DUF998 domain-containing protein [Arthrobacter sp. NPDC056691]|uniref:DUF998 domain-containing protein n=1 Tax=Arthrobacter sp. NPDC056691 TaxID=3345913 RepID=UPI00366E9777
MASVRPVGPLLVQGPQLLPTRLYLDRHGALIIVMDSVADTNIGLLGAWSTNRHPSAADSRHIIGSWAAKSALQYFAVEYLVHLTWNHYDYRYNVISALGARHCDNANNCGSSFVIMDLSFMVLGVGALVAASLITSTVLRVGGLFPKLIEESDSKNNHGRELDRLHGLTTAVRISLGVTGVALIGVGTFPEDYLLFWHVVSTSIVVVGSVATLITLGLLWLKPRPKTAFAILGLAAISVVGAIGFGVPELARVFFSLDLQWGLAGLYERLVVWGFIFGLFGMGLALTNGAHQPSAAEVAARQVAQRRTKGAQHAEGVPEPGAQA